MDKPVQILFAMCQGDLILMEEKEFPVQIYARELTVLQQMLPMSLNER